MKTNQSIAYSSLTREQALQLLDEKDKAIVELRSSRISSLKEKTDPAKDIRGNSTKR